MRDQGVNNAAFIRNKKRLPKGKYKYVYPYLMNDGSILFQGNIPILRWSKYFDIEKDAARAVDMQFIKNRMQPVNILTKKQ